MSLPIWTPDALRSECRPLSAQAWRVVEAQHVVSTLPLVDTLEEQALLEEILEETKPPFPEECARLHMLLKTPFRYRPYPHGSRFREAGRSAGVFYAAATPETALAEMVFYRYLFYAESPNMAFPERPAQYTAFSVAVQTDHALDLTAPPLSQDQAAWEHLTDYTACQSLAKAARDCGAEALAYRSVRDPEGGMNYALLSCAAFCEAAPSSYQSWRLYITQANARAVQWPEWQGGLSFARSAFEADPRLYSLR